jgi:hypothetical protein
MIVGRDRCVEGKGGSERKGGEEGGKEGSHASRYHGVLLLGYFHTNLFHGHGN